MTRLKRWWKEIGAFGLLTLFFGLIWRGVSKLVENAVVGWVDNAIGDAAGISGPSIGAVVSFIVDYGPPLAGAALVLLGYHLLVRPKAPKASLPVVEELPVMEDSVRMRSAEGSSLAAEAEDIAQRINSLGARLPLMMPDDPRYAAHGDRNNRMSDDYFMREYRESIETDVQRALGRANARKLLDANDRIYLLHKAAARRAVEEIMRVMTRIAVKEREGEVEERLLIRDAAVVAYETVEPTKFGQFVRQQYDQPEKRLEYVIRGMLIMSPPLEISAAEPPSTVLRPLAWTERSHLQPMPGTSNLRVVSGPAEPKYVNVSITRPEVDRYIRMAQEVATAL